MALLINGTIIILPLALNFDICLIQTPAITWSFLLFVKFFFPLGCVENDPTIQCAMIDFNAMLCHHFFISSIIR